MFGYVRRGGRPVGKAVPDVADAEGLKFTEDLRPCGVVRGVVVGEVRGDSYGVCEGVRLERLFSGGGLRQVDLEILGRRGHI